MCMWFVLLQVFSLFDYSDHVLTLGDGRLPSRPKLRNNNKTLGFFSSSSILKPKRIFFRSPVGGIGRNLIFNLRVFSPSDLLWIGNFFPDFSNLSEWTHPHRKRRRIRNLEVKKVVFKKRLKFNSSTIYLNVCCLKGTGIENCPKELYLEKWPKISTVQNNI